MTSLPSRRLSIEGRTYEGERLRLSLSVAKKLYRCPGCGRPIGIGTEHVFVSYLDADPPFDHEHWHGSCSEDRLVRAFASTTTVPAPRAPRPTRRRRR